MYRCRTLSFRCYTPSVPISKQYPAIGTIIRNFMVTSNLRSKSMKVAVLGAAGRTGSCLSLLLKQSSLIDELAIYDKSDQVASLALELSHIDTKPRVTYSKNNEQEMRSILEDAKVVVVTAGEPCTINKSWSDVLPINAKILLSCIPNVIKYCPTALVAIATSPINHLIPLVIEIYKKHGYHDHNRVFGITTQNCMRANSFAAKIMGLEPECVMVPVIGGDCSETCLPVFSQTKPCCEMTHEEISKLTYSVRMAEDDVARQYNDKGTSSLSMGFAAARFCISLCKALRDQRGIVECAYVRSCVVPEVTYFAGPLELGPCGIQKHLGVPPLTDHECQILASAIPHLKKAIKLGEEMALGPRAISTEICLPDPDLCNQEISGKMQKSSNNLPQACPT